MLAFILAPSYMLEIMLAFVFAPVYMLEKMLAFVLAPLYMLEIMLAFVVPLYMADTNGVVVDDGCIDDGL